MAPTPPNSSVLRVLMVEDSPDDAALILAALRRAGYEPYHRRVESAAAMRAALAEAPWEIVLSDYNLPSFNGLDALGVLRDSGLDLPFILVSGAIGEETAVKVMKAGAHDYVMKDNLTRLGAAIERELRDAEIRRERRRAAVALEEDAQVFAALARVGQELIAFSGTKEMLGRLGEVTTQSLGCDCSLTLLRQPDGMFVPVAALGLAGPDRDEVWGVRVPPEGVAGLLDGLRRRPTVQIQPRHAPTPWAALPMRFGVKSVLYVALWQGEEIIGMHAAGNLDSEAPFSAVQERIAAGIGQMASLALQAVQLVEQLDHANRLKSDFVATMSHELRTPLNIILGYNELLLEGAFGPLNGEQSEQLQRMGRSARELLGLVEETLDLGRMERGQVSVEVDEVAPGSVIDEVVAEVLPLTEGGKIELAVDVPPDLAVLDTDRAKLKTVLRNLMANAVKFTDAGRVTVRARAQGDGIDVEVSDTGIGIAPDVLPFIFEPFRQGENSSTRRYGGVGLGLYITHRLVGLLGGTIEVETQVGRGSTFRVHLPLALCAAGAG